MVLAARREGQSMSLRATTRLQPYSVCELLTSAVAFGASLIAFSTVLAMLAVPMMPHRTTPPSAAAAAAAAGAAA
eukprot:SAG22_NODE_5285_length_1045_cov_1.567653_3_plen_74_part_01